MGGPSRHERLVPAGLDHSLWRVQGASPTSCPHARDNEEGTDVKLICRQIARSKIIHQYPAFLLRPVGVSHFTTPGRAMEQYQLLQAFRSKCLVHLFRPQFARIFLTEKEACNHRQNWYQYPQFPIRHEPSALWPSRFSQMDYLIGSESLETPCVGDPRAFVDSFQ